MQNFEKTVPFDPGYSKIAFLFTDQISYLTAAYNQLKVPHQKKFQLSRIEPSVLELINKSTAFYLGCILWGGFVHCRFKNESKELSGNNTENLSEEQLKEVDCGAEAKTILEYIESFSRDCKYFLNRSALIPPIIKDILESYIEFALINNNFINVKQTSDVKLPQSLSHFENLSQEQLDALCDKIYAIIEAGKIEALLEIGFYKI